MPDGEDTVKMTGNTLQIIKGTQKEEQLNRVLAKKVLTQPIFHNTSDSTGYTQAGGKTTNYLKHKGNGYYEKQGTDHVMSNVGGGQGVQ